MTINELIEVLNNYEPETPVFVRRPERPEDFQPLTSVRFGQFVRLTDGSSRLLHKFTGRDPKPVDAICLEDFGRWDRDDDGPTIADLFADELESQ